MTLPTRNSHLRKFQHDFETSLLLTIHLSKVLVAKHWYRLVLSPINLSIKWWCYSYHERLDTRTLESLPPSKLAKLVALRYTQKAFQVVERLPKPPRAQISLSQSSNVVHCSEPFQTTVRAVITNLEQSAITVRSSGDQVFICANDDPSGPPDHNRTVSIRPTPSIQNFSIIRNSAGEEISPEPKHICSLTLGGSVYSRRGLTTLKPGTPLVNEFVLFENASAIMKKTDDGEEVVVRLRPLGVCWCTGTLDEIFGDQKKQSQCLVDQDFFDLTI